MPTEYQTATVPVAQIHPSAKPRVRPDDAVESLAADIRKHGLLHPLTVFRREDGTFQVVVGDGRLQALKRLGQKDAPVRILPAKPSEADAIEYRVAENVHRTDITPGELLEELDSYQRLVGCKRDELATVFHLKAPLVSKVFRTADRLEPSVNALWREGKLSTPVAYLIGQLRSPELQRDCCDRVMAKSLDKGGVEQLVKSQTGKGPVPKSKKHVLRIDNCTVTFSMPGRLTPDTIGDTARRIAKGVDAALRLNLGVEAIEPLILGKPAVSISR